MTDPLTPPDCDLRGLEYMPLLGQRLFGSEFNARATDREWRAAVTLWWAAWTQCPAASLPDDDTALCRLADLGRDLRTWRKIRKVALHGFILCADGRLYHPTLAQQAVIAWDKRVKERDRKAQWRAKKDAQNQSNDPNVPRDETATGRGTGQGTEQGRDADVPADGTRRDETGRDNILPFSNEKGAEVDSDKAFWDGAKAYLGKSKASMIGRWVSQHGQAATAQAITAAQVARAVDPVPYIERTLRGPDNGESLIGGPC